MCAAAAKLFLNFRWRSAIVVAAILFCACSGSAQKAENQDYLQSLSIEELAKVKVYSASRRLEYSRQAPAAVTIITADEIKRYGWRTLAEVLRSVRGFYIATDRQYTYLGVRGVLRPGDYNTRVLLQLNGHRLNDNIYDQAMIGTEFPLDLDLIDHIEIVRGPGSSLYGSNAVFAIINLVTRRPSKGTIEASGETGSFLSRTGRVTVSGEKGLWSGLFSGSLYHSNGPEKLFFPEFATPATNNGIAQDMAWDRFSHAFVDVEHGNLRVQSFFGNRTTPNPTGSYGVIFNDPTSQNRDIRAGVDVSYRQKVSPSADLDLRTYFDTYEFYGPNAYTDTGTDRYVQITRQRAHWAGAEANLGMEVGKHRITIGGDYEYTVNAAQKNYIIGQPASLNVNDSPWLTAVYGEAELNLIPKVTLRAGGRFDWFSTFGGAVSPRFAVIYSANPRTTLKYIVGRAFRAPGAYEEFYVDNISIEAPPKPLRPENIWTNEVVFERTLTAWLSMTADAYYNNLGDIIDEIASSNPELSYFANDRRDHVEGLELELNAKRASGFEARASYSVSHAVEVGERMRMSNSPLHQAKANVTVPISRPAFAGFELLYFSKQHTYGGVAVPASVLGNLTLSTRPIRENWELSASCYNVFNHPWFSPMAPYDPEAYIRMDGRTFRFKITYRLGRERK